jgi:hypothetical protein
VQREFFFMLVLHFEKKKYLLLTPYLLLREDEVLLPCSCRATAEVRTPLFPAFGCAATPLGFENECSLLLVAGRRAAGVPKARSCSPPKKLAGGANPLIGAASQQL